MQRLNKNKNDWNAALASTLVVGLGQILKGRTDKGLFYLLWFYAGLPIVIYISLLVGTIVFVPTISIIIALYPIFWLYNIYDALKRK